MNIAIRLAQAENVLSMLAIYVPIVRKTPISFEIEPPSEAEFKQRIHNYLFCFISPVIYHLCFLTDKTLPKQCNCIQVCIYL